MQLKLAILHRLYHDEYHGFFLQILFYLTGLSSKIELTFSVGEQSIISLAIEEFSQMEDYTFMVNMIECNVF